MTEEEKAQDRFTAYFDAENMTGVEEIRKKAQDILKRLREQKQKEGK